MSDAPSPQLDIPTLYSSALAGPLNTILVQMQKLTPLLDALPAQERQKINEAINASQKTGQEAFVAPYTLSALPALQYAVQSFNSGCEKAANILAPSPFTPAEKAALLLRWEPLDQFSASMEALTSALTHHKDAHAIATQIMGSCEQVKTAISASEYDALFHAAVTATIPPAEAEARVNSLLYNVKKTVKQLIPLLGQDRPDITALKEPYAKQCTLSDKPVWAKAIHEVADTLEKIPAITKETTPEALEQARETLNQLRTPSRALNALLLATNTPPGKNDEMLALTSQITAECWSAQREIAALQEQKKAQAATTITDATATQITPEPNRAIA